jgi:hypothetical protein
VHLMGIYHPLDPRKRSFLNIAEIITSAYHQKYQPLTNGE